MNSSILIALTSLVTSAVVVYLSCEYFVNGIEWVGRKAGVSQNAVGTVLAAFGTALPESVVTFVAVVFGRDAAERNIGVGAALGGPLALATIAYPVVGAMLLWTGASARKAIDVDAGRLSRDQAWFLLIFAVKIALGFVAFAYKPWLGWLFLAAYGAYTYAEVRAEGGDAEHDTELEPLKFQSRSAEPHWLMALTQTCLALTVIFAASHWFVNQLNVVGPWLGIPSTVAALLFSPIATELPETMNAIIWIRQGKHRLALANISGSMMIQATVPTALGLWFTPWRFDQALSIAAAVTLFAVLGLYLALRRGVLTPLRLSMFAAFYGLFAAAILWLWRSGGLESVGLRSLQ